MSTSPVRYCLNTSTIRGQKLGIVGEVEVASTAGYQGIEPWIRTLEEYQSQGGSLTELRSRIHDAGLTVDSAIAFPKWISNDADERREGLEQARREMEMLKTIGGSRIACPPAGATKERISDLDLIAERYAALCDIGRDMGVTPQLEVWGFSATLSKLREVIYVLVASGHPQAMLLADAYHLYKGESSPDGLRFVAPRVSEVFHLNDYPDIPPAEINDKDRVMPGDGIAPLTQIIRNLISPGRTITLSLELFSPSYWQRDALEVAREGLAKMKVEVGKALGE
ncbi:sugar phosphate isomerase/epimerase family protein [Calycomorphotria hydatis]|uniref:Inosose isomerase n=1 Tax=Calycomorphotria hydatis TaxID=2528027 RepID=A0A517TAW3_9PLAN|nr:sugar phosphate isomerase/epimerase family protein [Calycomorphotria hydatis]QDT65512.1 Inosose isomerase [Calycomorphotria hydatis]